MYDLIIAGCGPAGLSASLTAEEKGLNYLIIEKDRVLDTFYKFGKDKSVMAYPNDKDFQGPLSFQEQSSQELINKWKEKAESLNIRIEELQGLEETEEGFEVKTDKNSYSAENVLIAIGIQGKPRFIGVPGEKRDNVFHNCLPDLDFENKKIVIVGGGDTALEAACMCQEKGADALLSYRRPEFFRPKEENIEKVRNSQISVVMESNIKEIKKDNLVLKCKDREREIDYDYVLICAGTVMPKDLLEKLGVKIDSKPQFLDEPVEVKPGLFVAGDLVGKPSIKTSLNQGYNTARLVSDRLKE